MTNVSNEGAPLTKTTDERSMLLAQAVAREVAAGYRVESQTGIMAVLVKGRRVNHLLHFLIGIFTIGLWWIVWIFLVITGGEKREVLTVDDYGNILKQKP